jgi:protein SCO1
MSQLPPAWPGRKISLAMAILFILGIIVLFEGARQVPAAPTRTGSPFNRVDYLRAHRLANVGLTDHDGRTVRFYDDLVAGRIVAINFMYAACSKTCALSSQAMGRLQDELAARGAPVALYSISLDPERDTPDALSAYRERQGAKPGWTFLRPRSVAEATQLRRSLGVYEPDEAADEELSNHTGMIILGNEPEGRWTMVPSLVHPTRIRQAMDRVILPPDQWDRGKALVDAVPSEISERSVVRN